MPPTRDQLPGLLPRPPQYPEHDKLAEISTESQAIGAFLDWLQTEKHLSVCERHEHSVHCDGLAGRLCGLTARQYVPAQGANGRSLIETLLAEYFHIDLAVIDREKDRMVALLRSGGKEDEPHA